MSRVMVTGGAGFIGSHVVDALRAAGHEPVVFDLRASPWHGRREVETVRGDLCDVPRLARALAGCDAVAHLAAAADVDAVQRDPLAAERANARGTACVLEAARRAGVARVIYASTVWVYSDVAGPVVDESSPLVPPAHLYTSTKLAGELYCRSYAELYGVEYTILRFGIPYGPRARPTAVVPAMTARALAGEALRIAGDGRQTRRFVYVEDLADGVVRALAPVAANRVYNLVSAEDVSIRRVAETIGAAVGAVSIEHTPGRSGDFGGASVDGERARTELGWEPRTSFDEGVGRYVEWVRRSERGPQTRMHDLASGARRAVATATTVGALAALAAAVGSVHNLLGEAPRAGQAMALALPPALAAGIDWPDGARRRVAAVFGLVAIMLVALLFVHAPGAGDESHDDVLLAAASSALAAVVSVTSPARRLRRSPA